MRVENKGQSRMTKKKENLKHESLCHETQRVMKVLTTQFFCPDLLVDTMSCSDHESTIYQCSTTRNFLIEILSLHNCCLPWNLEMREKEKRERKMNRVRKKFQKFERCKI